MKGRVPLPIRCERPGCRQPRSWKVFYSRPAEDGAIFRAELCGEDLERIRSRPDRFVISHEKLGQIWRSKR